MLKIIIYVNFYLTSNTELSSDHFVQLYTYCDSFAYSELVDGHTFNPYYPLAIAMILITIEFLVIIMFAVLEVLI